MKSPTLEAQQKKARQFFDRDYTHFKSSGEMIDQIVKEAYEAGKTAGAYGVIKQTNELSLLKRNKYENR